ncbi:hypothetical protein GCK72_012746 [Caenorhabditis remanei]|uniref:Uncharacterized protein n=1 Tax=Caenorhabditis remanei TaxID=31234 RepID=A0A6A5GNZ8_CAERE|nr:hypothetical protein GCK72_012746 [Caenorhabditis remanei]KAF1756293.1 hypothetical protein GCK72_012746 [Caenorhabditis remanei]
MDKSVTQGLGQRTLEVPAQGGGKRTLQVTHHTTLMEMGPVRCRIIVATYFLQVHGIWVLHPEDRMVFLVENPGSMYPVECVSVFPWTTNQPPP